MNEVMNENVFKEILGKALMCELAELESSPEHKFSLRHRLAMKRIFARFERKVRKLGKGAGIEAALKTGFKPKHGIKQRFIIATLIVILMAFLVGWVVMFFSKDFHGTVYHDNTLLNPVNYENCPQTIERRYALASVPEGFELIRTEMSAINDFTMYKNDLTGQTIVLSQWVKTGYENRYNTEHRLFEEVTINGRPGLYIDFSDTSSVQSLVVWDDGDYIFEVMAFLNKDDTIKLCNFYEK